MVRAPHPPLLPRLICRPRPRLSAAAAFDAPGTQGRYFEAGGPSPHARSPLPFRIRVSILWRPDLSDPRQLVMLLRVLPVSVIFSIAAYAAVVERVGHVVAVLAAIAVFFLASLGSALLILALTEKVGEGLASFYFPSGRSTPAPKDFSEEKALVARGRVDAALAMVEARLHATPDDAEVCIFAADLHAREAGQPRQAESLFRRARDSRRVTAAQDLYATQRLIDLYLGPLEDEPRAAGELRRLMEKHPATTAARHAATALRGLSADPAPARLP